MQIDEHDLGCRESIMYGWKRFWCPTTEPFSLSDAGFLYDPDSEYGGTINPNAAPFERIHEAACLVLLGEPGIGKSTAIDQEVAAIQAQVAAEGNALLQVDLSEYGDERRLIDEVFSSPEVTQWARGDHVLHLFLDSLDECRLLIPQVAKILHMQLRARADVLDRLRLRIACRTADWPHALTNHLAVLWGAGSPAVYELAPLRRIDVLEAARASGIDAEAFLAEVIRVEAQPLAIKPVTLKFLVNMYERTGGFPAGQASLYEQGCRLLCEETSSARQAARLVGDLSGEQRLRVAELIAAATVFCNKTSVYMGVGDGEARADDLTFAELEGGSVTGYGSTFEVDRGAIQEVIGTGLFSSGGPNRVRFAHRTYAEFLAASCLVHQPMDDSERLKLIRHADDPEGRIVPQLRETAAWLAGFSGSVFEAVANADAQVLLRSDIRAAGAAQRAELLQRLLDLAETPAHHIWDWEDRSHYHKLAHPTIADQLAPYLSDNAKDARVRRFAIEVAHACAAVALQSTLADLALDPAELYDLRYTAAHAVLEIGDAETQLRLKPLALGIAAQDPELRLKAAALRCLWPAHISAMELFGALVVPPDERVGIYGFFLSNELPETLAVADLPHALRWASRLSEEEAQEFSVRDLVAAIAKLAWDNLDDIGVQAAMVDYALLRLRQGEDVLTNAGEDAPGDEARRRLLTEGVVPRIEDFDKEGLNLLYSAPGLVRDSDVEWMTLKLRDEQDANVASHWARLIRRVYNPTKPGQLDTVLAVCETNQVLNAELSPLFEPVELESEAATQARSRYAEYLKLEQRRLDRRNPPPLDPPPAERIELALQECEAGDAEAWYFASRDLQLEPTSTNYHHDFKYDLTTLPGWASADPTTKLRIVQGAWNYLTECDAEGDKWLGTNETPYRAFWGYKALLLLARLDRRLFESLPAESWARWSPSVVWFHDHRVAQPDKALHNEIAAKCLSLAANAVRQNLRMIFERAPGGEAIFILPQFIERAWSEAMEGILLAEMVNTDVVPVVAGCLLDLLLEKRSAEACDFALSLVRLPISGNADDRERSVLAAKALLRWAEDAGWKVVWPAIQSDDPFGKKVMEGVAYNDMHNPSLAVRLSEADTAHLYIWLETKYPQATDRQHKAAYTVGPRDAVATYRDGILRVLRERGTPAAITALRTIRDTLPHLDWMPLLIAEAIRTMLRKTWRPLSPADLLAVTRTPATRLVQSAAQLQDVIFESLSELQIALQGETPEASFLWDKLSEGRYRPKDENELSNYIKRHLEKDLKTRGIVSLREVEIRRSQGGTPGERTDIHVTGIVPGVVDGAFDQVRVIIEVKGSWHREVDTAMQTQLVDRYLRDNSCAHGIYLVGWYRCAQWDQEDPRLKKTREETVAELQQRMTSQAESLTDDARSIRAFALNAALR